MFLNGITYRGFFIMYTIEVSYRTGDSFGNSDCEDDSCLVNNDCKKDLQQ